MAQEHRISKTSNWMPFIQKDSPMIDNPVELIVQLGSFGLIAYLVVFYTKKLSVVIDNNTTILIEVRNLLEEMKKKN